MQPDLYSLTRKVAVVTGGGKGLGKTLTRYLLEEILFYIASPEDLKRHIEQGMS